MHIHVHVHFMLSGVVKCVMHVLIPRLLPKLAMIAHACTCIYNVYDLKHENCICQIGEPGNETNMYTYMYIHVHVHNVCSLTLKCTCAVELASLIFRLHPKAGESLGHLDM